MGLFDAGNKLLFTFKHKQLSRLQILKGERMWTQHECFFLAVLAICFKSQSSILPSSSATVRIQCEWRTPCINLDHTHIS